MRLVSFTLCLAVGDGQTRLLLGGEQAGPVLFGEVAE